KTAEAFGKLPGLLHEVGTIGIEDGQPCLQIPDACGANAGAVLSGAHIANLQFHAQPVRLHLFIGLVDTTETAAGHDAVINPALRHKGDFPTGINDTTEIFAVVISQKSSVPWAGRFGQLAAHQPRSRLHMPVSFPLSDEALGGSKIMAQGSWNKRRLSRPKPERRPGRRQE